MTSQDENIKKTNTSFKWTTIAEASAKIIAPLMNMVLARLLSPDAFGIVASITVIVSFAELLSEGGFARYIVQHQFADGNSQKKAKETAFTCSLFVSLAILLIVVLCRDPFASAVNAEGYGFLLSIAAIQIPLYGLSSIQVAIAQRNFSF
jgi:O-antigen/teichoic acid export membrane protein